MSTVDSELTSLLLVKMAQIALERKQLLDRNSIFHTHCEIRDAERFGSAGPKPTEPVQPRNTAWALDLQVSFNSHPRHLNISREKNHAHAKGTFCVAASCPAMTSPLISYLDMRFSLLIKWEMKNTGSSLLASNATLRRCSFSQAES